MSVGRTLQEGATLLQRVRTPEAVEAVSMDMSASFPTSREAVLASGSDRAGSFSRDPACDESVPSAGFEVGVQKRRHDLAASQTASLFASPRGVHPAATRGSGAD